MTARTCASCTSCPCSLRARVNNLDLPIYTNPLKAEKQHIQVRRVLSKYDLISTLYEHRFSTSSSVYVLGDVDHFVVVGGLILRSWSGGQRGRLLCLRLTPVWHTVPKFRFNLRSSPTELGLFQLSMALIVSRSGSFSCSNSIAFLQNPSIEHLTYVSLNNRRD